MFYLKLIASMLKMARKPSSSDPGSPACLQRLTKSSCCDAKASATAEPQRTRGGCACKAALKQCANISRIGPCWE